MSKVNGKATAAYLRVSGDKQDTARQERRVEATGLPIAFWFRDNVGKNPRDQAHKRIAFQEMLRAVEADLIGKIVVDRQDRFGVADAYEWGKFITLLREHGTVLVDADGKDLSADDDVSVLTGTLGAITSTREQKEKAHRNVTGKLKLAAEGEYQGGYTPYGFDVVCFGPDGKEKWRMVYVGHFKRWRVWPSGDREPFDGKDNAPRKDPKDKLFLRPSIEEDRLKWSLEIFNWYADEEVSPKQIADRLNDFKVDPIFGEAWHKVTIANLLKNPAYIGMPAWNKRAASRFVEYRDGKVQEVSKANGRPKAARKRATTDYIQPAKPLFKPLVPLKTWNRVQAKLKAASHDCNRRAPATAALWLKPFLICGMCGKPMRATRGDSTDYVWPSYYCGTYGTYGTKNPTGCRCHRVKHEVLERIVRNYLAETTPKVAQLLEATETGNALADPLVLSVAEAVHAHANAFDGMLDFIGENAPNELPKLKERGRSVEEVYGMAFERVRPGLEAKIRDREGELDKMVEDFRDLTPRMRERANVKMEALQAEIDALQKTMSDLRVPWDNVKGELRDRREALNNAEAILGGEGADRQKTEALRKVIDKIVCNFRHTGNDGKPTAKKSFLDTVEIVAVSGESYTCRLLTSPGPG